MAFLLIYTLFWCSIQDTLSIPTLDYYLPSREHPNSLRLECINDGGQVDRNARFKFYRSMNVLFKERLTDENLNYLTYNIAEDFEALVHCVIEGVHSEAIWFVAIPTVSNRSISTDVFRDTYAMLTCPIPLPTVRSLYTIMWEQIVDSTATQIMNDSESSRYILSFDNRLLSVLVSNSTDHRIFRCRINLQRCSDTRLCQSFDVLGPLMNTHVLERSAITVPPSSQMVTIGDTAIFHCNAKGSNISVRWIINGLSCDPDSCQQNGTVLSRIETRADSSIMINTTLEIRTGEFHSIMIRKNYTIQCNVEQHLDSSSLRGNDADITAMLIMNPQLVTGSDIATTLTSSSGNISRVTTDSSAVTTDSSADSSAVTIGVSVTISIVVLLGMGIGIGLTIFYIKKKRTRGLFPPIQTDKELPEKMLSDKRPEISDSLSRTESYVKIATLEGGRRPSEALINNFSKSNLLIPGRHIQLGHTIGQGEFGLVYQSYLTSWQGRTTAEVVAVKTLKSFYSAKNIEDLIAESERMKKFNHPNVMNLIGVCIDVGERPYVVMPFMANGSLLTYLKKERSCLTIAKDAGDEVIEDSQRKLLSMCLQVAKGMSYLAKQKFVHRDLAARNCMIDEQFLIKVGDFGLSEEIYTTNYFRQGEETSVKLPIKWMALESIIDGIFSEKTDVWSFGVTCWEIFSLGHTPYPAIDPFSLVTFLQNGGRLEKPNNAGCTHQVYTLITQCWNEEPEKRPCFEDLVHKINSLLERVAGYLDFAAFSQTNKLEAEV